MSCWEWQENWCCLLRSCNRNWSISICKKNINKFMYLLIVPLPSIEKKYFHPFFSLQKNYVLEQRLSLWINLFRQYFSGLIFISFFFSLFFYWILFYFFFLLWQWNTLWSNSHRTINKINLWCWDEILIQKILIL